MMRETEFQRRLRRISILKSQLAASEAAREKAEAKWEEARPVVLKTAASAATVLTYCKAAGIEIPDNIDFPDRARQVQAVVDAAVDETRAEKSNSGNEPSKSVLERAQENRRAAVSALTKDTTDKAMERDDA